MKGLNDVGVCLDACGILVVFNDDFYKTGDFLFIDEVDSTSSESSACHAGSFYTGGISGGLDESVEFRAAYLVVVSQAFVGCVHKGSEMLQVPPLEGSGGLEDSLVLGNDMITSAPDWFGESV